MVKDEYNVIVVEHLTKIFKVYYKRDGFKNAVKDLFNRKYKEKKSIDNVSLSIDRGKIVGILGANGAGKTTLLKMLSGVLYPTSGKVQVLGYVPTDRNFDFLRQISFVMGNKRSINWDIPAIDSLRYQQLIYGLSEKEFTENLTFLSQLLNVESLLEIQVRKLSLGERMKFELINALIYSPKVIFLDEPTIGLDISSQIAIRKFLKEYVEEKNALILLTSHYLDDIEEVCEEVVYLEKGAIRYQGNMDELVDKYPFKEWVMNMMSQVEEVAE